jgi:glutamine amidotransferase
MIKNCIIIDYGAGNLRSAQKALQKAVQTHNLNVNIIVSNIVDDIKKADILVLPGVGAFSDCMQGLKTIPNLLQAIYAHLNNKKPFLGICVGMQLLAQKGFEHGVHDGLGLVQANIRKIETDLKIPHMGWNKLNKLQSHPIMESIDTGNYVYFVHSYYMDIEPEDENIVLATSEYDVTIPAIIAKDNIIATQFHPEKSQDVGQIFLSNFLRWAL